MNIICEGSNNILNEAVNFDDWGSRNTSFTKMDIVIGPDGTVYNTKLIVSYVNNACKILYDLTDKGVIAPFLDALPIIYTFQVPTMATDGSRILINPGFVLELIKLAGIGGVAFVILHEVYHNVFKHAARELADPVKFSDHEKANAAQDYEINWIIEHTFPDQRNEADAKAKGDSIYDSNGKVKQVFAGITEKCHGLIDEKYKDDLWEAIYDKLGSVPKQNPPKQENNNKPMPMSDDMKDGYRDGWNDAIIDLRAKGLVESVKVLPGFLDVCLMMLNESLLPGKSKDYNTGYGLGYNAAMNIIKSLLGGASGQGQSSSGPIFEPVGDLETMKPKVPINPNSAETTSAGSKDPNTPVELNNKNQNQNGQNSQGQGQSGQSQNNQGQGQSGQGQGQSGQSQSGQGTGGQIGQGTGDEQGQENGQNQNGQGGSQGSSEINPGQSQGEENGKYRNGDKIINREGSSDELDSIGGSNSTYDDNKNDDGLISPEEAIKSIEELSKSGTPIKVGTADGGYNGKGDLGTSPHIITDGSLEKIAGTAGADIKSKKLDNPFKDPEKLRKLAAKLDEISRKNGAKSGLPGRGITDIIGTIEDMLKPKIDWKEMLKDYLYGYFSELTDIGYSKKGLSREAYYHIQDYEGETANRFLLFMDTSGSMFCSADDVKQCLAEINEIALGVGAYEIQVVQFCDGIYQKSTYHVGNMPDQITFVNTRSGGTSYVEIFDYIEDLLDENQTFNVAVIMTDSDCYYYGNNLAGRNRDPEDLDYADKIIWMIVDRDQRPLPYWTEAEKVLYLNPEDFNKANAFIIKEEMKATTKNKENKETSIVLAEAIAPRRCINSKLNEDYFEDFNDEIENVDVEKSEEERLQDIAKNIDVKRINFADPNVFNLDKIREWLGSHTSMYSYVTQGADYNIDNYRSYQFPVVIINSDYSIDVYGDITVNAEYLPEFIWFNEIKSVSPNRNRDISQKGSFTFVGGRFTTLPEGCPEKVEGNFKLIRCNNLVSLVNTPYTIGGSMIIQMCPKLKDVSNCIKNLYGQVLTDCNINYDDILNNSIYSRQFKNNVIDKRIEEALEYRKSKSLNEAFRSNIFRRLFNMRENRKALNSLKKINVFWSEIPDDIILPCYGNVQKSLQLRRVVNKDVEGYGITIWCNDKDEISIIGTGDNRSTYTDSKGKEHSWNGNSWLYYNDELPYVINSRIDLARRANNGDSDAIEACERIGIKYNKQDVVNRVLSKGRLSNVNTQMLFTHLYLIPDLCSRAYIIKGTDDIKDSTLKNPELYKNFSYSSQVDRRTDLQASRLESIKGMYLSAKNATDESPLYKKYINNILTDDVARNIFRRRLDVQTALDTIKNMIESAKLTADIARRKIAKLYNNNELEDLEIDALHDYLRWTGYREFIMKATRNAKIIKELADKNSPEDGNYAAYRVDTDNTYMKDINLLFFKGPSALRLDHKYGIDTSSYDKTFVEKYINAAERLASLLEAIATFERGSKEKLTELIQNFNY